MRRIALILAATAVLVVTASLAGTGGARTSRSILPGSVVLRDGDILFRRGTGVTSRIVAAADIDGKYSHVGIAVATDSGMMVVHAVPDEPDFDGDPDRVKMERPERFFSGVRAGCGAVARVSDAAVAVKAARFAVAAFRSGVLFDHDYDDSDTTRLYCCELVMRAYAASGLPLAEPSQHALRLPGVVDARCNLPSDIYASPHVASVAVF